MSHFSWLISSSTAAKSKVSRKRHLALQRKVRLPEQFESRRLLVADVAIPQSGQVETTYISQAESGAALPQQTHGEVLTALPDLSAEQMANIQAASDRPPLSDGVNSLASGSSEPSDFAPSPGDLAVTQSALSDQPLASGDFKFYVNSANRPAGGNFSPTNEPSVATIDNVVFTTGNWYASVSANDGRTFSYINPYTTFPSTWGGFCCDQRAAHNPQLDMILWYLQYLKSGTSGTDTGGVRVARANDTSEVLANTWSYYDFTPASFNLGAGKWLDYPNMQMTNNFAYFTSNVFSTSTDTYSSSVMWRVPLDQLQAGGQITFNFISYTDGTIGLPTGATDTMYGATVNSANAVIVRTWPDSSPTVTTNTISGLSNTYFGTHSSLDSEGNNWTGRADSRVQTGWVSGSDLGFMWNSAQSTDTTRPRPFVRQVVLNTSTRALQSQFDLWHPTETWHYPAIATNARGHLAGVVGHNFGNAPVDTQIMIDDDLTTGWAFQFGVQGANGPGQSRWGDFLAAQADDNFPNTWIAASFSHTAGSTTPQYFWFGRERDQPPVSTDDHGNDAGTSTRISVPSTTGGNIEVNADSDWFSFVASAGSAYTFETSLGSIGDTELFLYDQNGSTQLLYDDDSGEGFASKIEWTAISNGTYYLKVNEFGNDQTGTYSLTTTVQGPPDDYGNNAGTSAPVVIPSTRSGAIETLGDSDWFSFAATIGSEYTIETSLLTLADSELTVYGLNGTTILATDDDSGVGFASKLVWIAPSNGTYFVKVNEHGNDALGTYTVAFQVANASDDHGNNSSTATAIQIPSTTGGNIESKGDTDWFSFSAVTGGTYTILTTLGSLLDSQLTLYAADGATILSTNDDFGGGFASQIIWTATATGNLFLKANEFGNDATGTYAILISRNVNPSPTKFFVVDAGTTDRSFRYDLSSPSSIAENLSPANSQPSDIFVNANGSRRWVVNRGTNSVYIYNSKAALLGSWTASGMSAQPSGITVVGSVVYIVDSLADRVFVFAGQAGRQSGSAVPTRSFPLAAGNKNPEGLAGNSQFLWVVNNSSTTVRDRVFRYNLNGRQAGSWTLATDNISPTGIAVDPTGQNSNLWVVDNVADKIFQYNGGVAFTGGGKNAQARFALDPSNTNPQGISGPVLIPTDGSGGDPPSSQAAIIHELAFIAVISEKKRTSA